MVVKRPEAAQSPRVRRAVLRAANPATASSSRRASVSGSFGKPARIHSAWKARSARPTGRPAATPRAIRSAPLIGSLGSGVLARNRSAAAKAWRPTARLRTRPAASVSASRAASRPAANSRVLRPWNEGGAVVPCRPISAAAAALSRSDFGVGETQPVAQPLRVFRDRDAERGQTQESVAAQPTRGFDRDEAAEAPWIADAAEDRLEKAALAHRLHDLARARRGEELQSSARTRSRESRASPSRAADRGGQAFAIEPARGEAGREAEEPQNAQIILANPRVRVADEAHPARGEILEPADVIVDRSVGARATAR